MEIENRIIDGRANAARIQSRDQDRHVGACTYCSTSMYGCRSTVTGTHNGVPYEALCCAACTFKYVITKSRSSAPAAERAKFWNTVGEYSTTVLRHKAGRTPAPSPHTDAARAAATLASLDKSKYAKPAPARR